LGIDTLSTAAIPTRSNVIRARDAKSGMASHALTPAGGRGSAARFFRTAMLRTPAVMKDGSAPVGIFVCHEN